MLFRSQDSIYGPNSPIGLGLGMTAATVYGTKTSFDFTGIDSPSLQIVVDGTDVTFIDNTVQVVDLKKFAGQSGVLLSSIVAEISSQLPGGVNASLPGGFEAYKTDGVLAISTKHFGSDARIRVKADSTSLNVFGLDTVTKMGLSPTTMSSSIPNSDSTNNAGKVYGSENVDDAEITFAI